MALMKKSQRVNTVEAKNRLNELIAEVNETGEPVIVEKWGEPVAVVVDYASFQQAAKKRKPKSQPDQFLRELLAWHDQMRKKYPKGTGDSVAILGEIRQERLLK